MTTVIALDEEQLLILHQGALLVPYEIREWFMQATAARLGGVTEPSNVKLMTAVISTLASVRIEAPSDLFERAIIPCGGGCIGLPLRDPSDIENVIVE